MKMKKVLVTGGAGFIGSHIVDQLLGKEYEVVVLDDLSKGNRENLPVGVKIIEADITEDLCNIFLEEEPDIVIHTAAQVMLRASIEDPVFDAKTNILGTINVLEACRKAGVKKIVYTSTGGARVGEPEYLPVDEGHKINPSSPYGISKHTAEHYVKMYGDLYGIDYKIFCFGNVYGPRDDPANGRLTSVFINKILAGENPKIFGTGENTRDYLYAIDLAEFLVDSLEKETKSKLFHLANGEQTSVKDVVSMLKKVSGRDFEVEHIEAIKGEVKDIVLDTSLARNELGWKAEHSFEEGLRETYTWFEKNVSL
tara:strand:- start:8222 stop:9154 length:933 start_codon:yes stop_codon:yes gene_type:complete